MESTTSTPPDSLTSKRRLSFSMDESGLSFNSEIQSEIAMSSFNNEDTTTPTTSRSATDPPDKRAKYTFAYYEKQKLKENNSGLLSEFEEEGSLPDCTRLSLDDRFFPKGIKSGHIVEVKGPTNSGKTFLLTYFLALLVTQNPGKAAVLIDTSRQFSLRNLLCLVAKLLDRTMQIDTEDTSTTLSEMLEMNPQLNEYLDRVFVIKCFSPEEYLLTMLRDENSLLGKMVNNNPNISLIAIDSVDSYSYTEFGSRSSQYNILSLLKKAVGQTPIICTTIIRSDHYQRVYQKFHVETFSPDYHPKPWFSNIIIDASLFTHSMAIDPATEEEKEKVTRISKFKDAHYAIAYLRSRHKANMAGSAANHRVKFSIFSDMLWVDS